mmetsp:Transcript_8769/g.27982  ORF Transcript_8769/g.27982 Transcript_8769/m.27982 type:complete len:112 (-) Transcript_8769:91-426(-)
MVAVWREGALPSTVDFQHGVACRRAARFDLPLAGRSCCALVRSFAYLSWLPVTFVLSLTSLVNFFFVIFPFSNKIKETHFTFSLVTFSLIFIKKTNFRNVSLIRSLSFFTK